jgi:hypothetical protein
MSAAPDYAAPIRGWRVWALSAEGGGGRLRSAVYQEVVWPPRRELVARCLRGGWRSGWVGGHAAPAEDCGCGIYAFGAAEALTAYLESCAVGWGPAGLVIGEVALWGRVVECERGWRAQLAYPASLYVPAGWPRWRPASMPEDLPAALAADYGIPVTVMAGEHQSEVLAALRGVEHGGEGI